ncbi:MAG: hypothetical protein ACI9S8_000643 [Chlamydiales bacterium]|jgi:hypothetical protein
MSAAQEIEQEIQTRMISLANYMMQNGYGCYTIKDTKLPLMFNFEVKHNDTHNLPIPPILLATLPKSASVYIWTYLNMELGIQQMRVSDSKFTGERIMEGSIEELSRGRKIAQGHMPASDENLKLIDKYLGRVVVNVRDPRQAILSWVHFCKSLFEKDGKENYKALSPTGDRSYFDWPITKQIDFFLDNKYHEYVNWIEQWIDAEINPNFVSRIHFAQHRDLNENPQAYFEKILTFYGIDKSMLKSKAGKPKQGKLHFRKGLTDEWRSIFNPKQIEKVNQLMSKRMMEKFGWVA